MDRPVGGHIAELIATARATFHDVQVTRRDECLARALIDIEGQMTLDRFIEWLRQNLTVASTLIIDVTIVMDGAIGDPTGPSSTASRIISAIVLCWASASRCICARCSSVR